MKRKKTYRYLIVPILLLMIIASGCRHGEENVMTLREAIEIGKEALKSTDYPFRDQELLVEADNKNTKWNNHIKSSPSDSETEIEKKMRLEGNKYWAIYYYPKGRGGKGGDAFVFINRSDGKVIGVLFGE